MSRFSRDLAHWETLWHGGHASTEEVRRAMRELGADESYVVALLGPEPDEIESGETERSAAA